MTLPRHPYASCVSVPLVVAAVLSRLAWVLLTRFSLNGSSSSDCFTVATYHGCSEPTSGRRILQFAWHVTTIAWFGFAAVLVVLASTPNLRDRPSDGGRRNLRDERRPDRRLLAAPPSRRGRCSSSSLHWFGSVSDLSPPGERTWSPPEIKPRRGDLCLVAGRPQRQ